MTVLAEGEASNQIAEILLEYPDGWPFHPDPCLGDFLFSVIRNSQFASILLGSLMTRSGSNTGLRSGWYRSFLMKVFEILQLTGQLTHEWLHSIGFPWISLRKTFSSYQRRVWSVTIDARLDRSLFFRFLVTADRTNADCQIV
jgi:hypothetical protein